MKVTYSGHRDFASDEKVRELILQDMKDPGIDEVIVGGQKGFDLFVGFLARTRRKPFTLVLPCPPKTFAEGWKNDKKVELFFQIKAAKKIIIVDKELSRDSLLLRNEEMVLLADAVMAYWDGRRHGGTFHTINLACQEGKDVWNCRNGFWEILEKERTAEDIFIQDERAVDSVEYIQNHLVSDMERLIYESSDFDYVAGKVVQAHENTTPYPWYLTAEYISKKLKCSPKEAANLADCFSILDSTPEMVETFIGWVKKRGLEKGLAYFEKLAKAVAEAEASDPDEVLCSSLPADSMDNELRTEDDSTDDRLLTTGDADTFPTIRFHLFGYDEEGPTWEEKQPKEFRKVLAQVRNCSSLDDLSSLGKDLFSRDGFSRDQKSVLWSEFNVKKASLKKGVHLGSTARAFIQNIQKANGHLGRLGMWFHKVQKGQVKVANPPSKHEWSVIWERYNQAKEQHAH